MMRKRTRRVRLEDFTALEEPHPYGVLPGGNQFFGVGGGGGKRSRPEEDLLSDNLWQQVLSFCDAPTLAKVVQTSRYLYVSGHQPELWRDLVLIRCDKDRKVVTTAGPSWKDTYVKLFHDESISMSVPIQPHEPIPMPGIYSDEYYRTHLCRSFALPEAWLSGDNGGENRVAVVSVDSLTPNDFFEYYENKNQPLIIKGAGKTRALEKWQDPDYLPNNNAQSKSFRTTSGGAPLSANFTLEAYEGYSKFDYLEESPLYLFDRTAFDDNDQWRDDFFPEFYKHCPYFDPSADHGHDMLQHLGETRRPDHTWLIMGPKRSGSVFHIDPNATHAWNVCVQGRKRWIFYPPGVNPPGVYPSADGDEVALPLSVGEWLMQFWKEHTQQYKKPIGQRPLECTVYPGDVVYIPHGWWHMVINMDDRNIAITHNYVSPSNLGNVLKFFNEKQDQISGCRDRAETVKPECLHDELVKVLKEKEPQHLTKALSQTGWTCGAWKDDNGEGRKENGQKCQKRPREESHDKGEERKSLMPKTEKVEAFTFSFL
jgi:hypothetical protein